MPFDANGLWYPRMFNKQLEVFNSRARVLLVAGPRLSGKTRIVLHKILRHMWDTNRATVGIFSRTMKTSKDGGAWTLLTKEIITEWIEAKIGLRYTSEIKKKFGPKTDGITRTPFFTITNRHGTESECRLFSLDNDQDAEAKLKEMEFSLIYFSELDKFGDRKVLTVALPSLRKAHLKFEEMMWIADTNPSEEGDQSWIYKAFYLERRMSYEQYEEYQKKNELPVLDRQDFCDVYGNMDVIEILPKDNEFIDPRQLQEVKVACGSDQGLFARLVEGKWVWGGGDASRHFRGLFNRAKHVVGVADDPDESLWECALPHPGTWELITGWDIGETNHAAAVIEGTMVNGKMCFTVMDELVSVGKEISVEMFTEAFMEQITNLEAQMGRTFRLERAWSDRSSLEKYSSTADTYPHLVVNATSGDRIFLRGAPKAHFSVRVRVQLLKQLLAQGRFKVSAHCKETLTMLRDLKKGSSSLTYVVPTDPNKHIFDAITYALLMECAQELQENNSVNQGVRNSLAVSVS